MATRFTLATLLKQGAFRHTKSSLHQTRCFTHHRIPLLLQQGRRATPIFFQQKHWTSTVSSTKKPEERILYNNWLDHLPAKMAPYASLTRIDKPIGTWLLFWPCGKFFLEKTKFSTPF